MIPILDFQRRSLSGPVMKGAEFDLAIASKGRQLVKQYGLRYNPEEMIVDDSTADAVFQAGVDLLVNVGLYNVDTQRVVKFTREEVEAIAREYREAPQVRTFGRGRDEFTIEYRTGHDARPPVLEALATGVIEEDWLIPYVHSVAQEDVVRGFGISGGIASVGGLVPKAGTLTEIYCGIWEQQALAEALRRAGRPDMHLGILQMVTTVGGNLACLDTGLRGPHNTQIGIHIMPEQKIDWTRLLLAYMCEQRGIEPWTNAMSIIGGLCGGPAGAAAGEIANLLGQLGYGHGKIGSVYTSDLAGSTDTRECLWAYGAAARAAERNIRIPLGGSPASSFDYSGTEIGIWQEAAKAIQMTACGMAYCWGGGRNGLEARIINEIVSGVAGMEREKANGLIKAIMGLIEERIVRTAPTKKFFPLLYDTTTLRPRPAFAATCSRAVESLASLGVPISARIVLD